MLLEECIFLSILITYGLIRRKVVRGEMTTIVLNDQWISFISEYELVNIKINKSKVDVLVENKVLRRDIISKIGNKQYLSYLKASKQYNSGHLPPVINTCHISGMFLQSMTVDISDTIYWNKCINSNSLKRSEVQVNNVIDVYITTTTLIDNSPVLSSKYRLLKSLSIEISA